MITVYGRATSSNVQAVMWCIAELGLEYHRLDYGHVHGGVDTPQYRAMNPHGLVPTIIDDDGEPIWESAAIVRYLAARYGEEEFWPGDPAKRAQIDKWAEWGKSTLYPAFTPAIFWPRVRVPAAKRDEAALTAAIVKFEKHLEILSEQLSRSTFVCGEHLTVADIIIGHLLFRYFDIDIVRSDLPPISRYYRDLQARPHYQTHVMVDYSSLKADGA